MKTIYIGIFHLLFCFTLSNAQNKEIFKTKPGTNGWENLKTEEERFSAMQLPIDRLEDISTKELLKICLDYPAFGYISAYYDTQMAINILISKFNGLQELMGRKDAGMELLNVYRYIDTTGYRIKDFNCEEEFWTLKFMYVELLLAQDQIINSLSKSQKKELLELGMDKIKMKEMSSKFSSLHGVQSSVLIISRTLNKLDNLNYQARLSSNVKLEVFNKTGSLDDISILQIIKTECQNYLNSN